MCGCDPPKFGGKLLMAGGIPSCPQLRPAAAARGGGGGCAAQADLDEKGRRSVLGAAPGAGQYST